MPVQPYLVFNGNCREAVAFYQKVFQTADPKFMTFGDNPDMPEQYRTEELSSLIMHTRLVINGTTVMFSDNVPGMPFTVGDNITLAYISEDETELTEVYHRLKENGKVEVELQATSWSKMYAQVTDQYGIAWQLNFGQ